MRFISITILLIVALYACKEIKEKIFPTFTVNIPDIKLNIPAIPFKQDKEMPVGALKAHINMDSTIRAYTAGAFGSDAVSSVKVEKIVFIMENADLANNLSNFETGRMRIYSDNDTAAIDIANILFPKHAADSMVVTPRKSPDISNYLRGSELSYNIFWKNRKPTSKKLKLKIRVSLGVQ